MAQMSGKGTKDHTAYEAVKKTAAIKLTVWDVFNLYADIRDELDDIIQSFTDIYTETMDSLSDLSDGLMEIAIQLMDCDAVFRRYKVPPDEEYVRSAEGDNHMDDVLPFE